MVKVHLTGLGEYKNWTAKKVKVDDKVLQILI